MKPASRRIARLRDTDDCTEPTTSCTSPTVSSSCATAARTRKRNGSPNALIVRTISMRPQKIDIAIYRLFDIHAREWNSSGNREPHRRGVNKSQNERGPERQAYPSPRGMMGDK